MHSATVAINGGGGARRNPPIDAVGTAAGGKFGNEVEPSFPSRALEQSCCVEIRIISVNKFVRMA